MLHLLSNVGGNPKGSRQYADNIFYALQKAGINKPKIEKHPQMNAFYFGDGDVVLDNFR